MTQIIAGKFKGSTFVMADCIVKSAIKKRGINRLVDFLPPKIIRWKYLPFKFKMEKPETHFTSKIRKLESSESTYFTFTGIGFILNCVSTLDEWYASKQIKVDNDFYLGNESLEQLIRIINRTILSYPNNNLQLGRNRLFFINNSNAVYYDLFFDRNNKLYNSPSPTIVEEDCFIDSIIGFQTDSIILQGGMDIYEFCKNHLTMTINKNGIDYRNRFSFVKLDHKQPHQILSPYAAISDIIALYNEYPFDSIDDNDFFWNL